MHRDCLFVDQAASQLTWLTMADYFVARSRTDNIVLAWLLPDLKKNKWYQFHVPVYPLGTTFTIGITADDNDT